MNLSFFRSRALSLGTSLFICLFIARLMAGFQGIANGFGWGWALLALIAAIGFHLTEPMIIAAFVHAINAWHWHPAMAALFVTGPIICLLVRCRINQEPIPGPFVEPLTFPIRRRRSRRKTTPPQPWR
jgi:hypothetical protein